MSARPQDVRFYKEKRRQAGSEAIQIGISIHVANILMKDGVPEDWGGVWTFSEK